jgi:hypothetical protein
MPSRVQGIISTRRLLKRMPDAVRAQLADAMTQAGPELASSMIARAPRGPTGNLVAGIAWKFYPTSLRLVVGFIGKRLNRKLFYARILEGGRRAQVVTVTRNRTTGGFGKMYRRHGRTRMVGTPYEIKVRALPARRFVYGPLTDLRKVMARRLSGIWDRALASVAGGGNE